MVPYNKRAMGCGWGLGRCDLRLKEALSQTIQYWQPQGCCALSDTPDLRPLCLPNTSAVNKHSKKMPRRSLQSVWKGQKAEGDKGKKTKESGRNQEFDHRKRDCHFRQGSAGLAERVTWANGVELWRRSQ